jgi:hypothetical protein
MVDIDHLIAPICLSLSRWGEGEKPGVYRELRSAVCRRWMGGVEMQQDALIGHQRWIGDLLFHSRQKHT